MLQFRCWLVARCQARRIDGHSPCRMICQNHWDRGTCVNAVLFFWFIEALLSSFRLRTTDGNCSQICRVVLFLNRRRAHDGQPEVLLQRRWSENMKGFTLLKCIVAKNETPQARSDALALNKWWKNVSLRSWTSCGTQPLDRFSAPKMYLQKERAEVPAVVEKYEALVAFIPSDLNVIYLKR